MACSIYVFQNTGNGQFSPATTYTACIGNGYSPEFLLLSEINSDGKADILSNQTNPDVLNVAYSCSAVGTKSQFVPTKLIDVYPNPTSSLLNITLPEKYLEKEYKINLLDALGQQMNIKSTINKNYIAVDLTPQNKGVYFLQIICEGEFITRKIIRE